MRPTATLLGLDQKKQTGSAMPVTPKATSVDPRLLRRESGLSKKRLQAGHARHIANYVARRAGALCSTTAIHKANLGDGSATIAIKRLG